jgi:hypothetical protein
MSNKEYEAFNVTPPLINSSAMKCVANFLADHTARSQGLASIFKELGSGHYLTVQADGAKVYVGFGRTGTNESISEIATGNGSQICWPVPDGTMLPISPIAGHEVATGIATLCTYDYLHYMTGATGVTSYVRIYRSSIAPGQSSRAFPAP